MVIMLPSLWQSWRKSSRGGRTRQSKPRSWTCAGHRALVRPCVEGLEDRVVPQASQLFFSGPYSAFAGLTMSAQVFVLDDTFTGVDFPDHVVTTDNSFVT